MSFTQIPEIYRDDDIIYHYTSSEVALLNILKDMKLRLSYRSLSLDPIENTEHFYSYSTTNAEMGISDEALLFTEEAKNLLKRTKQISFCKNDNIENECGMTYLPFEKYGFAKPRMWDQYGNKYKGVCLAFSLSELSKSTSLRNIEGDHLKYISYHELEVKHHSLDLDKLKRYGETYKKSYLDYLTKRLFFKHKDYIHENEYRFCSFNDEQYDYLDIKNSLVGVIISELGINQHLYQAFEEMLLNHPNIDLQLLSFDNQNLEIRSYQSHKKSLSDIKSLFEEIKSKQTSDNEA